MHLQNSFVDLRKINRMSMDYNIEKLANAEAKVFDANEQLNAARKELKAVQMAAAKAADVNDFAACWRLYQLLKDTDAKISLQNRVGQHHLPWVFKGKIYAIKKAVRMHLVASVADTISYNLKPDGVNAWVKFAPCTKSWTANETGKYILPSHNYHEMPIERTQDDFVWSPVDRAYILKPETEKTK